MQAAELMAIAGGLALSAGNVALLTGIFFRVGRLSQAVEDLARRMGLLEEREQPRRAA